MNSTIIAVILVLLISVIGYYMARTPTGCTQNTTAGCEGIVDPHMIPGSAFRYCDPQTGVLDKQCTAFCASGWAWDKAKQACVQGAPPTCANNSGCGGPQQGHCVNGACVCELGFSGPNCQYGVQCNTINCGPGGACAPDGKSCICKAGSWKSGRTAGGDYVMCASCADGWGPGSGDCSKQWKTAVLKTNNCSFWGMVKGGSDPCTGPGAFAGHLNDVYNGQGISLTGQVSGNGYCDVGAPCNNCWGSDYQHLCRVTGWLDPAQQNEACDPNAGPRPAGSYQCCNAYQSCS